jgi:hypothetical protein
MKRDAVLNIRLPNDVKEAVRRAGDEDHGRSLSGMVVRILTEWCTEKGYLQAEPQRKRGPSRGK